jgi:Ser/Thr protein kinase RdoA (MazF antagonist)
MSLQREKVVAICEQEVLDPATRLFGTRKEALNVFADYEGAANLVYAYEIDGRSFILRVSYTPERSFEQIQAELHFVVYLAENGVRVSRPVRSRNGNLVEVVEAAGIPFKVVSFVNVPCIGVTQG